MSKLVSKLARYIGINVGLGQLLNNKKLQYMQYTLMSYCLIFNVFLCPCKTHYIIHYICIIQYLIK